MEEKRPEQGYSADGYIMDQDCFSSLRYRTMPASINGCGPVAVFNLLRFLGRERPLEEIMGDMDARHYLHAPGPTSMRVMRAVLADLVPEIQEAAGQEAATALAANSRAGIIRYREGREPHFVSYLRQEDGLFRFFNVADGLEDCAMSMERFASGHCASGIMIVLAVPV